MESDNLFENQFMFVGYCSIGTVGYGLFGFLFLNVLDDAVGEELASRSSKVIYLSIKQSINSLATRLSRQYTRSNTVSISDGSRI